LGQYARAVEVFRGAVEKGVGTDEVYAQLGNNLLRTGQQQPALDAMEKAAELNLANLQNLANLATLYLQMGRTADAQKTVRAILTQNDRSPEANNLAGLLEIQRGNGPQARSYFEKAIEANPKMAEAYMNLGLLADQAGQPQIARENFRKFLEYADPKQHGAVIPKVQEELKVLEAAQ
jgi:tetratricopeptide (TPR) repeat protein